jgi:hypothetical protein
LTLVSRFAGLVGGYIFLKSMIDAREWPANNESSKLEKIPSLVFRHRTKPPLPRSCASLVLRKRGVICAYFLI